jgi:serpin B
MLLHSRLGRTVAATGLAVVAACRTATEPSRDRAPLEALPRALTSSEQKVVNAANDFSFSFFRQVSGAEKDANVFTSPLSASMALGMTMNGAAGATYDQMREALAFGGASETEINQGYKGLISLLRGLDPAVTFRIANSIWYRNDFPFHQSFLDAGKSWFDAEVTALDFASPAAVTTINDWVRSTTAGKIPSILDGIDRNHVMFLINAIYFKGAWREPFDPALTTNAQFRGVAGNQPMRLMHRNGKILYLATPDFEAADLPYGNSAFTMTIVLPREGKSVEALATSLQGSTWSSWTGQLREVLIDLYLPRFKLEWERKLKDDLKALGMRDAFVGNVADFTRMSPLGRKLYVSEVKQKSYVDVNEEGTEAAAVTKVAGGITSAPPAMRVDRPFLFVIRERLSGTVIFMGKIVRMP